jgi:hypothetical protein
MVKTLASQARNGGSIPLARLPAVAAGSGYQAWSAPQWAQATEVETGAVNA